MEKVVAENQFVYGYVQKYSHDTDLDRALCLLNFLS